MKRWTDLVHFSDLFIFFSLNLCSLLVFYFFYTISFPVVIAMLMIQLVYLARLRLRCVKLKKRVSQCVDSNRERESGGKVCYMEVLVEELEKLCKKVTVLEEDIGRLKELSRSTERECAKKNLQISELRDLKERAEKNCEVTGRFISEIGGDLSISLNGIEGIARVFLKEVEDEVVLRYLNVISGSVAHLLSVVDDMSNFSRVGAGNVELCEKRFNIQEMMMGLCSIFKTTADSKGITIECEKSEDLPEWVVGDPGRIRQLLFTVIEKAIFHSKKSVLKVTAGVGVKNSRQKLYFSVEGGNGCAIGGLETTRDETGSVRNLGHVFSLAKGLVKLMGGELTFEDCPNSSFNIKFNIELKFEIDSAEQKSFSEGNSNGYRKVRILVAEDDDVNRMVMRRLLQNRGYDTLTASTGAEAIEVWDSEDVDMILMDIQMPETTGYEAAAIIRQREIQRGGRTPIIALSAFSMVEDVERSLSIGMDGHLSKPLDYEKMFSFIEETLART